MEENKVLIEWNARLSRSRHQRQGNEQNQTKEPEREREGPSGAGHLAVVSSSSGASLASAVSATTFLDGEFGRCPRHTIAHGSYGTKGG
eukprot:scaffold141984_cov62-Attheya_sp.AAC.1